jgi:mono/diheme cytochrome c family protein
MKSGTFVLSVLSIAPNRNKPSTGKSSALAFTSLAVAAFFTMSASAAEPPTFYADAQHIFLENCVACHQVNGPKVGGITAPMSLATYAEVRPWTPLIKRAVETGYMPPWGAHQRHQGEFKGERYLEADDKRTLLAWIEGGALEGDPADARPIAASENNQPASGWWIGDPDLIVEFEKPVYVGDDVADWQPTYQMVIPEGAHREPKWISKAELNPGGPWVHHIVSSHMGVGVPGRGPFTYPAGWGVLLPEDPFITVNMHYHKQTGKDTAVFDSTKAGFEFYPDGEVIDYVVETNLLPHSGWTIPAGDPNFKVSNTFAIEEDIYLLSMGPHMHYRGKAMRYELEYPDGERETLLWVPKYDFNWQFLYEYEEPKFIPAGATMHMSWWFDNSAGNPFNPDPTADVVYGPETSDEMANARIYYAPTRAQGIVVGKEIPADILSRARAAEDRRRRTSPVNGEEPPPDDSSWLDH